MKKRNPKTSVGPIRRRRFRLEWSGDPEDGLLYLFGVDSFGEYAEDRKSFLTGAGKVTVVGKGIRVSTFRSGGVEIRGRIRGVKLDDGEKRTDTRASD